MPLSEIRRVRDDPSYSTVKYCLKDGGRKADEADEDDLSDEDDDGLWGGSREEGMERRRPCVAAALLRWLSAPGKWRSNHETTLL